jgi:hypothetical protein
MSEIAQHHITYAVRVKNALNRAINLYVSPSACMGEIRRAAWQDYQKEFGTVSERTFRRIFDRAIHRDSGEENFDDLALYLGDRLSKEICADAVVPGLLSPSEQAIYKYLAAVKTPTEPTIDELNLIWFAVCETMQDQLDAGDKPKAVRRSVIGLLNKSAVRLSRSESALKKLLKLKYARYVACGGDFNSMADQRAEKSGWKRANVLSEKDRYLIVAHAALQKGGRLAPALRE